MAASHVKGTEHKQNGAISSANDVPEQPPTPAHSPVTRNDAQGCSADVLAPISMVHALRKCAETFRSYEQMHLAKADGAGVEKARRNAEMADLCDAALQTRPVVAWRSPDDTGLTDEQDAEHGVILSVEMWRPPPRTLAVGEAYWRAEEKQWWWANTDPGDHYAEPIQGNVIGWQPMPLPLAEPQPYMHPRDQRQAAVIDWVRRCFGPVCASDAQERVARVLEEAFELAQAAGLPLARALHLGAHVYSKPPGKIGQEIGGVSITLLSFAAWAGLSAEREEVREFDRIMSLPVEHFKKRHREKAAAGITRPPET